MALIKCTECGNNVSNKAEACPKCGAPILTTPEAIATGTQIRTIQETSKRLKVHILISAALFWGSFIFMYAGISGRTENEPASLFTPMISSLMMIAGLIWYIVTKARIWWHHK